jgi:dihydroflavonol-4-reductase
MAALRRAWDPDTGESRVLTTLITGASGFVGSHVALALVSRGESVRALLRPSSDARPAAHLAMERVEGDLRDTASLDRALRGVRRVFHVAADYRLWSRNPAEIYENNVTGTHNLLEASRRAGVERFVYTSTVGTIAVPGVEMPDEETASDLSQMIGHYKRSKFLAEKVALRFAAEGLPVVVVNPTAPVGPGDWKPTPTGRMIVDFLQGRMPAYVDAGLNVVAVEDVAEGHLLAARKGRVGERYILGGSNMRLKEILDVLAAATGRPAARIRLPHAVALLAAHVDALRCRILGCEPRIPLEGVRMARHAMFVNGSKAERELGFKSSSPAAALARAARWYLEEWKTPIEQSRGQKERWGTKVGWTA